MPPHVVCVAVQQHGVLLEVGLQLSPDQVVALLLLELHCTQQPRASDLTPGMLERPSVCYLL